MIKGISGGQGIQISGGNALLPYINMGNQSAGLVRYNGNSQSFEVYDGVSWYSMSNSYPCVELSPDVHELLQWAKRKRDEECRLKELVQQYPVLLDAKKEIDKAQSQFDMLVTLVNRQKEKLE